MSPQTPHALLTEWLADPETGWSLGTFGAAGEFRRRADEPCEALRDGRLGLRTARGALALAVPAALVPVAYETPVPGGWSQTVALCLPAGALRHAGRTGLTELGPDAEALLPGGREAILFDLGLGLGAVDVCLRGRPGPALDRLRARSGRPAADLTRDVLEDLKAGRLDLVYVGPLGRCEVAGRALADPPPGPRGHVVPRMLRLRRTHAATAPIPAGLVPCAHIHPAHPLRDAGLHPRPFVAARHEAFQRCLARWGDPGLLALRRHLLGLGPDPGLAPSRWTRAVARVAAAQGAAALSIRDAGRDLA